MENKKPARIVWVDELRAIAIISVMLAHSATAVGFDWKLHFGPDIFLMVSGASLVMFSGSLPAGQFLKKRFLRIFPAYWISIIVCVLFWWIHSIYGIPMPSVSNVLIHLAGLQSLFNTEIMTGINQSLWYITIAFMGYFAFIALRKRLSDVSFILFWGSLFTALATILYSLAGNDGGISLVAPRIMSLFIGMLAGWRITGNKFEIRWNGYLTAATVCLIGSYFVLGRYVLYPFEAITVIALWMCARRYIVGTKTGSVVLRSLLTVSALSYELYLIHQPFVTDMILFPDTWGHDWWGVLIGIVAAVSAAIALQWTAKKLMSLTK